MAERLPLDDRTSLPYYGGVVWGSAQGPLVYGTLRSCAPQAPLHGSNSRRASPPPRTTPPLYLTTNSQDFAFYSPTAIRWREYRIPFDLRSQAPAGSVSSAVREDARSLGAVVFFQKALLLCCSRLFLRARVSSRGLFLLLLFF